MPLFGTIGAGPCSPLLIESVDRVQIETTDFQTYQGLRPYLFAIAYRMTGSASDAEDLVHDAWIRYLDAGAPAVASMRAYLTTIVSRLSLDYLTSARVQREQYVGTWLPEPVMTADATASPETTAEERESVSLALLTLLEHLSPEQRVVYVLREGFGLPYDEIAGHLEKTAATCRQLFRRAQRRLAEHQPRETIPCGVNRSMVERFMMAFARGDTVEVASLLTDDVVWVADGGPNRLANRSAVVGRDRVSRGFAGLGRKPRPGMDIGIRFEDLNGSPAIVMLDHGRVERVLMLEGNGHHISRIQVIINPEKLTHLAKALGTEPAWDTPFLTPRRLTTS